jgi:hypothetical protein
VRRLLGILAISSIALVGCGGSGDDNSASANTDSRGWQEKLSCTSIAEEETEELYVRALFTCTKQNGSKTSIYTFNDGTAKANWRKIAEGFGSVVPNEGSTWLETK